MMQMNTVEFKEMCRVLKIFPVVVAEEIVDKVTVFSAAKRSNTQQPSASTPDESPLLAAGGADQQDMQTFEFNDFVRAFRVSLKPSSSLIFHLVNFLSSDFVAHRLPTGQRIR